MSQLRIIGYERGLALARAITGRCARQRCASQNRFVPAGRRTGIFSQVGRTRILVQAEDT
jgi:hypothetical protein